VNSFDLTGKVAIVTGSNTGLGAGMAIALATAGCDIVGVSRADAGDTAAHVEATGRRFADVRADLASITPVNDIVRAAVEAFGRVDVLVNNAGGSPYAEAATASPRFSSAIVALNLLAPLYLAQKANAVMQGQEEGGVIVNVASVSGTRPSPGTAAYGAAKAGLLNLTQSLAVEWAPKVRVNAVTPGLVHTEQSHLHYGDAAGIAAVAATVPMGRMGEPRDVAEACFFLASPGAAYMTGANLLVHGGGERPAFLAAARTKQG
jgi:NAD(P)-dependent dehydrogenase (short-subunit alcohol dehydrogenase family)